MRDAAHHRADGQCAEGDRERCVAVGMNDYIAKPIDPALMFPTLIRYLPDPAGSAPQNLAAAPSREAIANDEAHQDALRSPGWR